MSQNSLYNYNINDLILFKPRNLSLRIITMNDK